jgi:hypothetical protein
MDLMTPKNIYFFLTYEYPKNAKFYADFKPVKELEPKKNYLSKTFTS